VTLNRVPLLKQRDVTSHLSLHVWDLDMADDFRSMRMGHGDNSTTTITLDLRKLVHCVKNPRTSMSSCQTMQGTQGIWA
uniref:Uncharacterized protein n=1 Tax=Equus asinus asinus TaxID=83772 RepID=A0A8C4LGJ1_EQUAS